MIGMKRSRRHEAERIAGQAWNTMVSTVEGAGESARSTRRRAMHMVDDASNRVSSTTQEARRRANAAFDALAGRQPAKPWGWLLGAAIVGAVLGWLANVAGRQAMSGTDEMLPDDLSSLQDAPLMERRPTWT